MEYKFAPFLILRMPAGNPDIYKENIQLFLDDQHFLSGLLLASPTLFSVIEKHGFNYLALPEKAALSLKKYVNRFCYRPTPFGLFASVSLISWAENSDPPKQASEFSNYCRPDMMVNQLLADSESFRSAATTFEINPSIYRVLNEYRFIRTWVDTNGTYREYQLQTIAYASLLKDLVDFCRSARSRQDIIEQIMRLAACTSPEAADYADFLIDAQILVNSERPAITGQEQFAAISDRVANETLRFRMRNLSQKLSELATIPSNWKILSAVQQELNDLVEVHKKPKQAANLNVILKRTFKNDHLPELYQRKISNGLKALSLLSQRDELPAMTNFVSAFVKHFEGQSVPLMVALDPEAGIGYQQPLRVKNNPLLETLPFAPKNETVHTGNWTMTHGVLMAAWLRDRSEQPIIRLHEDDLAKLKGYSEPQQILGISTLFRIIDDKVVIENAGGINAPALMGRFTVADEKIKMAAGQLAQQQEALNPDVIFAELLQLADPRTDNVNTREHIYRFEIPITASSTLSEDQQISLTDLYVCIVEHKAILFSYKHQKIVVPRLSSAYNHSLNKLPLFRFLADIPYQYGQYHFGFDLRHFFPGQSCYPRVEFEGAVLSLASWIISKSELEALHKATDATIAEEFNILKDKLRLPDLFSLTEGDQELVFDSSISADLVFFSDCTRTKAEIILREYLEIAGARQYNAFLSPDVPLRLPKPNSMELVKIKSRRKFIPGSEWLYLKIYAPKIGADRLLLRIRPLLTKRYNHGKIVDWFFIRYEDHAPHIRLRLKVVPEDISEILFAFKAKLQGRIHQHLIREYQVDIYSRELERYAFAGIEKTERVFGASSELVINFLQHKRKRGIIESYAFALCSTRAMIAEFFHDPTEQVVFTLDNFQQFSEEFGNKPCKVDLDKKYRALTDGIESALANQAPDLLCGSVPAAKKFLACLKDTHTKPGIANSKAGYLASLIHMHLNRIFTDEGRKQEMIIYYLLHKYLLSARARARKQTPGETVNGSWLSNAHP